MNPIETTLPDARHKCRKRRRGECLRDAVEVTIRHTTVQQLEETWRNAPRPVGPHDSTISGRLHPPLIAGGRSVMRIESIDSFEAPPGTSFAVGGRKMSDESTDQGGERSESQSALIDESCSRFETAWRTGQGPRIEGFLPAESPDIREVTRRTLLAHLVGIDLEWRWKTADVVARQQTADMPSPPAPLPDTGEGSEPDSPLPPEELQGVRVSGSPLLPGEGQGVRALLRSSTWAWPA